MALFVVQWLCLVTQPTAVDCVATMSLDGAAFGVPLAA